MCILGVSLKDYGTLGIATIAATVGLFTYWKNAKTRRAEFILQLHKAFFVEASYKSIRKALDLDTEKARLKLEYFLEEEPEEFTDFLNYFELVAYLQRQRNLSPNDVKALLGYYLQIFLRDPKLRAYISEESKSFEHLNALLGKLESAKR